jgi:hypothetical protein
MKRIAAKLVLAAGAAASIATSIATWQIDAAIELDSATIPPMRRLAGYAIHVEVGGESANDSALDGHVEARVTVRSVGAEQPAIVRAWITTAGDPADVRDEITVTLAPRQMATLDLYADAFVDCTASTCTDDVELWIERVNSDRTTPAVGSVEIGGEARIYGGGLGDEPRDAFVAIDAMPLAGLP